MKSITRYTVEGCKHYDNAEEALAEACLMVYVTQEKRKWALEHLRAGHPVTLTYGFCSVEVTPPREDHPEIKDPRDTVLRAAIGKVNP